MAGDIGAVAKLKETQTGDTLADKAHADHATRRSSSRAGDHLRHRAQDARATRTRSATALHRLLEEDPALRVSRDAQTHEMLLSGMGQLHIEVVVGTLRKRYKVEVNLKPPKIPYRETIKGTAEGHGRHKKQTGGHGQFADCKIKMEPLPRGEDFEFVDDIFGGSIPRNFIPAVEKGIQEARLRGLSSPASRWSTSRSSSIDGQYHDVDSSEMAFKIAGSLAFKDAVAKAGPRSSSRS